MKAADLFTSILSNHLRKARPAKSAREFWGKVLTENPGMRRVRNAKKITLPRGQLRRLVDAAFREGQASLQR